MFGNVRELSAALEGFFIVVDCSRVVDFLKAFD
jgi:hypothetical protein